MINSEHKTTLIFLGAFLGVGILAYVFSPSPPRFAQESEKDSQSWVLPAESDDPPLLPKIAPISSTTKPTLGSRAKKWAKNRAKDWARDKLNKDHEQRQKTNGK